MVGLACQLLFNFGYIHETLLNDALVQFAYQRDVLAYSAGHLAKLTIGLNESLRNSRDRQLSL